MGYIGAGPTRFNTADELTVTGDAEIGGIATVDALKLSETDVLLSAGETAIITSSNDVQIIRDGSIKLTATATGVDVTGGLNTTGNAGIGTSSPGGYGKLVSLGGDNATLFAAVGSTNMLRVQGYNSTYLGTVLEAVNLAQSANTPMFVNASEVKFGISGTERMRIDTSGKVGIGTSSPSELLEVNSTGASTAIEISAGLASTTTGEAKLVLRSLHSSSGTEYSRSEIASLGVAGGDSDLIFRTTSDASGPVEHMRIDSEGNVGIGGTATANGAGYTTFGVNGSTAGIIEHQANGVRQAQSYATTSAFTTGSITAIPMTFGTNNTERMRIDSSGNVGIGRVPDSNAVLCLNVSAGVNTNISFAENGTNKWLIGNTTGSDSLRFYDFTSAAERMQIDSSGNVGIGISPQSFANLQVKTATDRNVAVFDNAVGATICGLTDAGASTSLRLAGTPLIMTGGGGAGAEHMSIASSGYVKIVNMPVGGTANMHWSSAGGGQLFVTSSSSRFKHSITDYDKGLAEVLQMQPKYFVYNDEPSQKQRAGFIAEDFHTLGMTEFVEYWQDENDQDTPSEIGYSNMVAILVKSIQEQQETITALEARIAALENA